MPSQIINGQTYDQYSPGWYAAQQNDAVTRSGVAGNAAGTGEAAYLSKISPSLAGLYSATGVGGAPSSNTFGSVNYPQSFGGASSSGVPSSVSSSGLSSAAAATPPSVAQIAPIDLTAADTASFATAKDNAAKTAQASMLGLNQALASRGLGGGGYEAGQVGNTLSREANTIGEAGRAQAVNDAALRARGMEANLTAGVQQRGQDIGASQANADRAASGARTAFEGDISQRGQTIGAQEADAARAAQQAEAQYSGSIAQRGQDISAATSAADLAQRAAALKSQQSLAVLQSVLGGGKSFSPSYVY